MTEAICGPSNALQHFKQQTQHDRTLQQDRLVNKQHSAQGFRSADPNAGLLDLEFEAFQAGVPAPGFPQFHQGPSQFQQHFQEPSPAPSWAADFNRMSLASPPPVHQHLSPTPSTARWAQSFQAHVTQNAPRSQNSSPSPYAFQQRARYGMHGFQSNFAQSSFASAEKGKGNQPMTEQFDEAAFERAFDMARQDMVLDDVPAQALDETHAHSVNETQMNTEEISDLINHAKEAHAVGQLSEEKAANLRNFYDTTSAIQARGNAMTNDTMEEENQEPQRELKEDDDDLAATAQKLLENIEHNQTDKFRNSQFLSLMRKLRDREVKVRGDKMVEIVSATHLERLLTPDSTYGSGTSSPAVVEPAHTQHNPTICKVSYCDVLEDHRYDHWESPYT